MSTRNDKPEQVIAKKVMQQIESGKVSMRPRWQFIVVTVLGVIGIGATAILAIYLTNLVVFKLRITSSTRPLYGLRANVSYFTGHFPWLAFVLGVSSIGLLIWVLRKFDFSYHFGRWLLVLVVALSLATGTAVAFTSLNNHLETFGPMRGIYGPSTQQNQNHGEHMGAPQHNNNGPLSPSQQNGNGPTQHHGKQHEN